MSGPNENAPTTYLEVTNHSAETLVAAFHGDEYVWEPGEKLNMSEDAARHVFGFGLSDKSSAFHRLGWLNTKPDGQMKDALNKLKLFQFTPVQQVFQMAERKERKAKKAGGSDRSLAGAGENSGAVDAPEASPVDDAEAF